MAAALILEFDGGTEDEYRAVSKELGIDLDTGTGDWPEGLITHSGGINDAGNLVVMEVWDTPEHQARFMDGRLTEAMARAGVTREPASVTWIELTAHHHVGG